MFFLLTFLDFHHWFQGQGVFLSLALGSGLGCVSFTAFGFRAKVDFFGNFYFLPCSDP